MNLNDIKNKIDKAKLDLIDNQHREHLEAIGMKILMDIRKWCEENIEAFGENND